MLHKCGKKGEIDHTTTAVQGCMSKIQTGTASGWSNFVRVCPSATHTLELTQYKQTRVKDGSLTLKD